MATSILKRAEWLSCKPAQYGHGWRIGQAGFRDRSETACFELAQAHNAGVSCSGRALVCLLAVLLAGCSTSQRGDGAGVPDWEREGVATAPVEPVAPIAPPPPAPIPTPPPPAVPA